MPNSPNSTDGDEEDLCRDSNSTMSAVIDELSELEIDELLDGEITFAHYQRLVTYIENVLEALSTYIPDVRYRETTCFYLMHCMHIPMKKKKRMGFNTVNRIVYYDAATNRGLGGGPFTRENEFV